MLAEAELRNILNTLNNNFEIAPNVELTLEANPDDINDKNLEIFAENGINRLSIGIQSFFEEDLRFMNRAHTAKEAIASLDETARR